MFRLSENTLKVSIVVPIFRRPDLLRSAVASALAALPDQGEVVVTDDGDVEATRDALASFDQSRLVIEENTGAKGAGANRNNGVAAANGNVIFFLDDDDLILPDYPQNVLNALAEFDDAVWGFSSTIEHDKGASPNPGGEAVRPIHRLAERPVPEALSGLGCGFWIKRDVFQSVGGIRNDLETNEDTDFCLTLLRHGFLPLYSAKPGVSLFRGEGLTRATDAKARAACFQNILERHADFFDINPDMKQFVLSRYLKHAARGGDFKSGLQAIGQSGSIMNTTKNFLMFAANLVLGKLKNSN